LICIGLYWFVHLETVRNWGLKYSHADACHCKLWLPWQSGSCWWHSRGNWPPRWRSWTSLWASVREQLAGPQSTNLSEDKNGKTCMEGMITNHSLDRRTCMDL
jgi:hypothetical protein